MTFSATVEQIKNRAAPQLVLLALQQDVERLVGGRCVIALDSTEPPNAAWTAPLGSRGAMHVVGTVSDSHAAELEVAAVIARGVVFGETEQSEMELRAILGAVLDGIITTDEHGLIERFNLAAERMFGFTREEVRGQNVNILMGPDHASRHDGYMDNYRSTGQRKIIGIGREVEAKKKDGTSFWIDLGVTEYRVRGVRKFTGILRDLSTHRELEAQLRQSQKLEAVGTLAAGVAHDFNNILMGIGGCLHFAASRMPEEAPAQKFLQEARNAADRGSRLTRQLLHFSRRAPTEHNPVELHVIVQGMEVLLQRLVEEHITIETELGAADDRVIGDVGQLEQVVVNLVVNARDAMPDGGLVRLASSNVELPEGPYVRLSVSDHGHGMDEITVARIFEPFFTTKPPDKGTGLGLSTVYGIIESHDGRVRVDSRLGVGTTFHVELPLTRGD